MIDLPIARTEPCQAPLAGPPPVTQRPEARGKFLFVGEEKLWVRGVTYGTFAPDALGLHYPPAAVVEGDFAAMARGGINAVRVYTVPPRWLLDLAQRAGLRVMVGLPWEQHIAFLDEAGRADRIVERLRGELAPCLGHPALLAYAIGNEIPASVARWHGKRRIERFLGRLAALVRREDPTALITYVNFPTSEYLDLPFVDFHAFNVYLETEEKLSAYLARLQNIAGEKPLLMAEVGLDSRRNGLDKQAEVLAWQIRVAFERGCLGTFLFAWTDEWHRGGYDIDDWHFGLVTRDREPKPALAAVSAAFTATPIVERDWPRISVVVCSYNGAATIGETLAGLASCDYPDYEVIVVNDGSTDATPEIASRFDVRLISTENRGLSAARNIGMDAATGEIIAYTDDDAWPDPHWLKYLALAFMRSDHAAIGGPNIAPPEDGDIAECVANGPGGPMHVLIGDELAEHIPGCNMAYRSELLRAIGGFDPQFRVAGDDVDCCWRIEQAGGTLGFCAAAMVWHHRRPSIRRYLRQQRGYACAEALLAAKWPSKYNNAGHLSWHGRLYGRGLVASIFAPQRIYYGSWGSALFQSIYAPGPGLFGSLPLMPEWYFITGCLLALGLLGLDWPPLLGFLTLGLVGLGISVRIAVKGALAASFPRQLRTARKPWQLRAIVGWLHLLQPLARLVGRVQHGLGPWRATGLRLRPFPSPRREWMWSERWAAPEQRLETIRTALQVAGAQVGAGGDFDRWDLAVSGSLLGGVRALAMVEEHGGGRQLFRLRLWPHVPAAVLVAAGLLTLLALLAAADGARLAALVLGAMTLALAALAYTSCATAMAGSLRVVHACLAVDA